MRTACRHRQRERLRGRGKLWAQLIGMWEARRLRGLFKRKSLGTEAPGNVAKHEAQLLHMLQADSLKKETPLCLCEQVIVWQMQRFIRGEIKFFELILDIAKCSVWAGAGARRTGLRSRRIQFAKSIFILYAERRHFNWCCLPATV